MKLSKENIFSIVGPSGSGKTTLLGLCAGLDHPDSGTIELCGHNLQDLNEDERAQLRNKEVGFIFQNFQLLPTLTALENVSVPLELQGEKNAAKISNGIIGKSRTWQIGIIIIRRNYLVVSSNVSLWRELFLTNLPFYLPMNLPEI